MHPSLRVASAKVHQPLIKFVGRRVWPSSPEPPHAHPAAPADLKEHFADFLKNQKKLAAPSGVNVQSVQHYAEFWEAPSQFWSPRVRTLEDWEIDAVQ
ncbi:hypothetical protein NEOLEDRAFT_1019284, partial [Neolentinus lepideus HHB14362 ss-1]